MVLGSEDGAYEAGFGGNASPLAGVKGGRGEDGRIGDAGSPLGIREGIDAEVKEESELAELPGELGGRGERGEGQRGKRMRRKR